MYGFSAECSVYLSCYIRDLHISAFQVTSRDHSLLQRQAPSGGVGVGRLWGLQLEDLKLLRVVLGGEIFLMGTVHKVPTPLVHLMGPWSRGILFIMTVVSPLP